MGVPPARGRLRVVLHFSSGIVERSTIRRKKGGTTRSLRPGGAVLTELKQQAGRTKGKRKAAVHARRGSWLLHLQVLCVLIWLCFLSKVSDKNLKLAAVRVNTNIFVTLNSIEMGKEN